MRTFVLAMVAAMAATSATAMDLPVPGLALNTEVKAFHKVDAETNHITLEPELRFTPADGSLSLYGSSLITAYETDHASGDDFAIMNIWEDGYKPTLDLGAEYTINANAMVYGETSWDFNAEDRGEIEVGLSFNF
jgi:hypothetical protein